jgi:hypothetical protein
MYQVVIRTLGPISTVFDFAFGQIADGQFVPVDTDRLPVALTSWVNISSLLGTQAYVQSENLAHVMGCLISAGSSVQFFPNFIVFTLPEGYVTKEKEAKE